MDARHAPSIPPVANPTTPSMPAPPAPIIAFAAEPAPVAAPRWRTWQCVLFRYALCHYVLYSLPMPISHLLGDVMAALQAMQFETSAGPVSWLGAGMAGLFAVHGWWEGLTSWLSTKGLAPYEVIHQPTGSGDTAHDIARLLVVIAASLLLTTVWSLLRWKPTAYPRLGRWLHLVVRFDVAFQVLGYGLSKLHGGQFGDMSLTRLTQEIGDTAPMTMVGTFMKASKAYEIFGGLGEVIGPLLLFHHRTALLGALVTTAVMANVCALNWLCGVPVKLYSTHLLLFSVALLAPFAARLWALLVTNAPSNPIDLRVVQATWARRTLVALGTVWVLGHLVAAHVQHRRMMERYAPPPKSAIYGVWLVEKMVLDGQEVPITDATRWRFLAVDRGTRAWARTANGQETSFEFAWDPATGVAKTRPAGAKDAPKEDWTVEVGKKTMPCDVQWVLRNEDRRRKVDDERRTLVVKGKLDGKQLELHTYEKVFPLLKGFRLRQELPEFW